MATQSVIHSAEQSKLAVVAFPAPQAVTQLELTALLSLRGRLHQLEQQVSEAERSIKSRLEKGCAVENGDHVAKLETNSRRNVSWKSVCIRLADRLKLNGARYCARVVASTKPTKTTALVLE